MYEEELAQAAAEAETVCAEETTISGIGKRNGVVDRMSAEKMLKRGTFGQAGEGVITIVYRRTLFTTEQIRRLASCSVLVPSFAGATPLAIMTVEQDPTWVTVLAQVR